MSSDLNILDATAQAELVRRGDVRPIELVDAAIARIERLNPQLNAVIATNFEKAREQAQSPALPAGPFRGVPFLLKDLGAHEAGQPFHCGMRALKAAGWVEREDSFVAANLRAAGFIILGRTNTPELGLLPTTEPEAYGATRNPWMPTHSPGGSSGGASAAVASGMVPAAHATDGGGSIRIPASQCGLVGLKPSRGRVSLGPKVAEGWGGFSAANSVTVSVRDTAAILDILAAVMPGEPYAAPTPARPYTAEVGAATGRLRIGLMTRAPGGADVHPDCVGGAEGAARLLASLGHTVDATYPEAMVDPDMPPTVGTIISTGIARVLDSWGDKLGRALTRDDVEPMTWEVAELGRGVSGRDYLRALEFSHTQTRRLARWWHEGFDLLLTPTVAAPPPPLGTFDPEPGNPLHGFLRAGTFSTFTSTFNATGQPAISLPLHWTSDGLPIGVQLVAAYGREDLLIRIAAQIEQAQPWAQRRAPIHASRG